MKKYQYIFSFIALFLITSNANAGHHDAPSIGMNPAQGMCHLISAEGDTSYKGPGEIKVTMNKKFAIAKCKAELDADEDVTPTYVERADVPCHFHNGDGGFYEGYGGFTTTSSGNVIARCKAELVE